MTPRSAQDAALRIAFLVVALAVMWGIVHVAVLLAGL